MKHILAFAVGFVSGVWRPDLVIVTAAVGGPLWAVMILARIRRRRHARRCVDRRLADIERRRSTVVGSRHGRGLEV